MYSICKFVIIVLQFVPRKSRFVPAGVHGDAVHILRPQRRLQLRLAHGHQLLAVHLPTQTHDAAHGQARNSALHLALHSLLLEKPHHRCAQPDDRSARVPARLRRALDRIQFCHGNKFYLKVPIHSALWDISLLHYHSAACRWSDWRWTASRKSRKLSGGLPLHTLHRV